MKYFLFVIAYCMSISILLAQNYEEIYNEKWYLHEILDIDTGETFKVEGYQPYNGSPTIEQIHPYIIIDDNQEFTGKGICNTFDGTVEEIPDGFRTLSYLVTTESCGFFEDKIEPYLIGPFGIVNPDPNWISMLDPNVTNEGNGLKTFTYITQPFILYTYRNTPVLHISESETPKITVYPNPTSGYISISSNEPIKNLRLWSTDGTLLKTLQLESTSHSIALDDLSSGIYILQISTTTGINTQKISIK